MRWRAKRSDMILAVPLWFRLAVLAEAIGLAVLWLQADAWPARFGRWVMRGSLYEALFAFACSLLVALLPALAQVLLVALWIRHKQRRARIPEARARVR
jgi:hypothetical protein